MYCIEKSFLKYVCRQIIISTGVFFCMSVVVLLTRAQLGCGLRGLKPLP